jgi:hypothetical protein
VAVAAFAWRKHEDRPTALDRAAAFEVSGAVRGHGLSVDVEVERTSGASVAPVDAGLFADGRLRLTKAALEGGYMIVPRRVELVAAVDAVDVEALDAALRRLALGASWYLREHRLKVQVLHRETFNDGGRADRRAHATYVMTQVAF